MASARRRYSLALAPSPPCSASTPSASEERRSFPRTMASARRRYSLALAPSPPCSASTAVGIGGSASVGTGGSTAVGTGRSAAVAAAGSAAVAAAGRPAVAAAMFRPPRPLSTAAGETGRWNGSVDASPFSQFGTTSLDTETEMDESRRQMQEDMLNHEEINGEDTYTGCIDSGYFTDLLVNGGSQSQLVTPTDPSPPNGRATAKNPQGRSKNFRDEKDILLVSGWLNVSMDPIQGVDQTQGAFWKRIHAYFHQHKTFESNRSEGSLMNHWSGIQHDVNLFCGYMSKIELRNHSGWTFDDKISNACAMFTKEDPKDRKFPFLHCWNILKDKPKWMDRRREIGCAKKTGNKKQKTIANSSPASVAAVAPLALDDDGEPTARPDGKKKEKQKLKQRSTIEVMDYLMVKIKEADNEKDLKKEKRCNKAFALQEERLKLEKEKIQLQRDQENERFKLEKDRFQFEKDQEEERILNLDLSTMNYKLQQYYAVRQEEILTRRCNM